MVKKNVTPMNIWIFNHYAIGPNSSGGTRHYDLAKQLVKKGYKVTIFASSFNHQTRKEEHFLKSKESYYLEKQYDGVRFIWIKTFPYTKNNWRRVMNMLSYTYRAFKAAKAFEERPDIIIGSLVHPLAAYLGYIISKKKDSIFYFEERDLWPQTLIDLGKLSSRNPVIIILKKLETFLYQKAQRIIVLFEKAPEYVVSQGVEREKIIYLPNGVDIDRYKENNQLIDPVIKSELFRLKDKFLVIYTGAHGLANNLDTVLNAAKIINSENNNIHFLLIGDGTEKVRLEKRKKVEGIDNVTFLNPIAKEEIPFVLRQVDIGLLPLTDSPVFKWGISPNKMFDYMASELPTILLCNIDDSPIEKSDGGTVIKEKYLDNLVSTLLYYYDTQSELDSLGQRAKKYIELHHVWEVLASKLEEFMLDDVKGKK